MYKYINNDNVIIDSENELDCIDDLYPSYVVESTNSRVTLSNAIGLINRCLFNLKKKFNPFFFLFFFFIDIVQNYLQMCLRVLFHKLMHFHVYMETVVCITLN